MTILAEQGMHDARWTELVRSFETRNRAGRDRAARDIAEIAAIYQDHRHHWREFQDSNGIAPLHRGRTAGSRFHAVCRHLCELGLGGDETGRASVMAGVLEAWARTAGIAPAEIPAWIARTKGGIRAIYDGNVHTSPAHNDDVYTGKIVPLVVV
jgi:hypothetical protein